LGFGGGGSAATNVVAVADVIKEVEVGKVVYLVLLAK